jgi:xanthine dehydrogenase accessory factor
MLAGNFKVQTIYNHLRARGVPDEQLRKVHAPIGLEIAAETPEEIALSIASELVFVKNQRTDNKAVSGDIPAAD